jgi:hypothetical protein
MDSRCKLVHEKMISLAAGEGSLHASQKPVTGVRKLSMEPRISRWARGFSRMAPCPCLVDDAGVVDSGCGCVCPEASKTKQTVWNDGCILDLGRFAPCRWRGKKQREIT